MVALGKLRRKLRTAGTTNSTSPKAEKRTMAMFKLEGWLEIIQRVVRILEVKKTDIVSNGNRMRQQVNRIAHWILIAKIR